MATSNRSSRKTRRRGTRKTTKKKVEKPLRTRCLGHYQDLDRCTKKIWHNREQTAIYCGRHAHQALAADPTELIRYCDGLTPTYQQCSARVSRSSPGERPACCGAHEAQKHLHKTIHCHGVDDAGDRCITHIRWGKPFKKFCHTHEDQQSSFGCPIDQLSDDAASMIFDLLEPHERTAFALTSKACAGLMKVWRRGAHHELA